MFFSQSFQKLTDFYGIHSEQPPFSVSIIADLLLKRYPRKQRINVQLASNYCFWQSEVDLLRKNYIAVRLKSNRKLSFLERQFATLLPLLVGVDRYVFIFYSLRRVYLVSLRVVCFSLQVSFVSDQRLCLWNPQALKSLTKL